LSDAKAALFAEAGITDWTTIASLDLPAFTQVLGDQVGTLPKRYKLKRVAEYLSSGKEIGPDTTMGDINLVLLSNHQNVGANAPNPAAGLDPRHGTMKASINTISKFSGDLEDFEDWSTKPQRLSESPFIVNSSMVLEESEMILMPPETMSSITCL
jgi:hypothetical protein